VNAQGVFWGPHKQWNPSLAAMAAGGIKTVRDRRVGVRLDDERAPRGLGGVARPAGRRAHPRAGAVRLQRRRGAVAHLGAAAAHRDPGDGYGIVGADGRQTATAVDYLATLRAIDDGSVGPPGADQPCWGPGLPDFGEL
jgi:hypothetical protein